MKTLTKILTVVAVVALCVCLFTLTAFAATYHEKVSATCTTTGFWEYYEQDGKKYKDAACTQPVDDAAWTINIDTTTAGHDLQPVAAQNATCYSPGYNAYWKCSRCGKLFSNNTDPLTEIPAPVEAGTIQPHTAAGGDSATPYRTAVPATCGDPGNVEYYLCQWCGKPIADKSATNTLETVETPATGLHAFGAWTEVTPATQVKGGTEMRVCGTCGKEEYRDTPPLGVNATIAGDEIWSVIPVRDTWFRGEENLLFRSNLIDKLNSESGPSKNYVGVRIGTDRSLYDGTYYTFDFWSWDDFLEFGDKMLNGLDEGTYYLWVYDRRDPDIHTNSVPFYIVDVPTLEPYSTDKHVVNSSKSLRFIASEEIDPNSVRVGSKYLYDANDYFVSNDRKNVTLSADFLNNRQTGTYTISARTKDGQTIKTNFYILTTAQASSSPRTGDESQIGLWAAFLLLSGAAVVVLVPKLRKQGVK